MESMSVNFGNRASCGGGIFVSYSLPPYGLSHFDGTYPPVRPITKGDWR